MPVHDWTRVPAGIFHHFHFGWIFAISRALNDSLPPEYYAMGEQVTGGPVPDVIALERSAAPAIWAGDEGGVALAPAPPQVEYTEQAEAEILLTKTNRVVLRHVSGDVVVAMIEIVSPGNKSSAGAIESFALKAAEFLAAGIHVVILDLFPPAVRDPHGIHPLVWSAAGFDSPYTPPPERPLTLASYCALPRPQAHLQSAAVGQPLPEVPVFLTPTEYLPLPLEPTYDHAFEAVPRVWREVLE